MHVTYGGITGNPAISVPVVPLSAISEPLVIFPSVAFPPPVILSPCAKAGVIIDVPTVDVTSITDVADAIAAAATKNVASILPFIFDFIAAI